ncbi:hypothetical protein GOBAR_AA08285 [Gossypium barbadense]|uniref:Uncharacterized protein n=1 Tax=Gossypium barbadense TaxID=3634 RepID=A0A2P5Y9U0_GOSBA|nr:hypothetical protein GOBAR_AA08285 [Gossypium barbadense]
MVVPKIMGRPLLRCAWEWLRVTSAPTSSKLTLRIFVGSTMGVVGWPPLVERVEKKEEGRGGAGRARLTAVRNTRGAP